ncbi:YceI family protein [Hwangdonia lutea]|uniref:YceI family protein n=1 Tax=Hwangdonia lutea TaxID=3075823 RepID=A0AA97EK00_9FLAO|nr:YceI family protein [Hwangdonia sp. SCSIO 19198]WOD42487.1 YceI family protein [Hwangdonia sp. SCSIO 19198]
MKRILLFFPMLIVLGFTYIETVKETAVHITPESSLIIKGKTNVNKFDCEFDVQNLESSIPVLFEIEDRKMVFKETQLVLSNSCFDCGNKAMNKDFYNLLNSDEHPNIILKLKKIEGHLSKNNVVNAHIDIDIAGVVNSYNLPLKFEGEETMNVSGVLNVNICDFNLEPPKKALGLIVVDDWIQIQFQLKIREY